MSFRQYGGINYAARNNIVKNNFTNASNLSIMNKVGQPDSKINVESTLDVYAINLTSPTITTNPNGVVPKSYVDLVGGGLKPKAACQCATTVALSGNANPTVGTYSSLTIDGYIVLTGNRVLIKNQQDTSSTYLGSVYNGIYDYTIVSGLGTFARSSDYVIGDDAYGAYLLISNGVVNGNKNFIEINEGLVGTSVLLFTPFTASFAVGQGLEKVPLGSSTEVQVKSDLSNPPFITTLTTGLLIATGATSLAASLSVMGATNLTGNLNATGINTINGYATTASLALYAPLASPALTGTPTAITAAAGDSSLQIATTAFVQSAVASGGGGYWATSGLNIYNTNSGKVGIGTTTPQKILEVFGDDAKINLVTVGRGTGGASNNTALGLNTLMANIYAPTTTGNFNSGFGCDTLKTNTTGNHNTAVGSNALFEVTIGSFNTSIGSASCGGAGAGSISCNTAVGFETLNFCNANNNTAVGYQAGKFIGSAAPYSNTNNTLIGYYAGGALGIFINNCILLGANSTPSTNSVTNEITLGDINISSLRCQATNITGLSDLRDKKKIRKLDAGLDFINELNPVRFDWNMRDGGKIDIEECGFIAQDLQKTQIDMGIRIPNLVSDNNPDKLEASYGTLIPVLVKAIQEMSSTINRLEAKINELTLKISAE